MSDLIQSFSVASGKAPTTLILGSIPGVASLEASQYYAHPRNAFWPIVCAYYGIDINQDYNVRLEQLNQNGVALWDVLKNAERKGSLDSAIKKHSIIANPIDQWLATQERVKKILLNGGTAKKEFMRHFASYIKNRDIDVIACPSTSPAYAAMRFEEKQQRWHAALSKC
ncbi:DNA-deoxyinosine glycosylase [Reinekea thalattae]|uniref:DNA-deoxyinosine glycosylase n=1 Tax=Reinekea thalattae TaxID=2593301 RepID=A0A5C8ZCP5_9GAMM|nr:DNA-deoxyinosine glycosylase [Reinekea thalattae]TXR54620.1 DNA-deoxyinosine glycosylase [Reinekea thalattae]